MNRVAKESMTIPLTPALDAIRFAAALLLVCSVCTPAFAQTAVDLQLVLAVDASGSVDQRRFKLQQQGYVAAFHDPRVLRAIQAGGTQAIAVTMVQWTGPALQIQVLPWTLINDATTAHAFAAAIAATPRQLFSGGTSISGVIDYAVPLMFESQFKGTRRVIDISGDGRETTFREWMVPPTQAREQAVSRGITVNGLAILNEVPTLKQYFEKFVIGGEDAFAITADSYADFADAMRRKLLREIGGSKLSQAPGSGSL